MWDGIIIGGGLAGLAAGIRAAERGKKVLMISEGSSSLMNASGVLDFGDVSSLEKKEGHPYSLFGKAAVHEAFDFCLRLLGEYSGAWGIRQEILTPLGTVRSADLVPNYFRLGSFKKVQRVILAAPDGLKDFFPGLFKDHLQRLFPGKDITIRRLSPEKFSEWHRLGKEIPAIEYARFWRSEDGIDFLGKMLRDIEAEILERTGSNNERKGKEWETPVLIVPGLSAGFSPPLERLISQAPFEIIETIVFPPAPGGYFLEEKLKRIFLSLDGEFLSGKVLRALLDEGKCQGVFVESKGKETLFKGGTFVLASGGFLGGGIKAAPNEVVETVFGFPLYVPEQWTDADFLAGQPYAETGVEIDQELCPFQPSFEKPIKNVLVAGRMIAHWDPWTEQCGGGVSITSGYLAGEKI